jgi:hypothetical protein
MQREPTAEKHFEALWFCRKSGQLLERQWVEHLREWVDDRLRREQENED